MTLLHNRRSPLIVATAVATCAALLVGVPSANADFIPAPLHFSIDVSGGSGFNFSDSYQADVLFPLGNGQFAYEIDAVDLAQFFFNPTTFTIGSGTPTGGVPAGILTGLAFQNKTNESLQVVITYLIETKFAPTPGLAPWDTNVSIGVNNGTTVSTFGGMAFWTTSIDGTPVAELFTHPSSLTGIDGAASADMSKGGFGAVPEVSMAIQIAFSINPGGQAFFNGNFTMIPAPGSLALLALGGIVAVGRRRRTDA